MRLIRRCLARSCRAAFLLVVVVAGALPISADATRSLEGGAATARSPDSTSAQSVSAIRTRLLREDRANHYRAPAGLLDDFAVFSARSLHHNGDGVRVTRPSLTSLPLGILSLSTARRGERRDVHAIREVALRHHVVVWVEPGANGISMFSLQAGSGGGPKAGADGVASTQLRYVMTHGMTINVRLAGGKRIAVGVVPDTNRTIRARTKAGRIITRAVIDGVYTLPTGLRHVYIAPAR